MRPLLLGGILLSALWASSVSTAASGDSDTPGPTVLDAEFVEKFRSALSDKSSNPLQLSMSDAEETPAVANELRLLATEALVRSGHVLAAQLIAMDVAAKPAGPSQAAWALSVLDRLAQTHDLDDAAFEMMAFEYDAAVSRPSERAMMAWYRGKAFQRRGFSEWAARAFSLVSKDTRWYSDRLLSEAIELEDAGKEDIADSRLAEILKRKSTRLPVRVFAELRRARQIFEKGNYGDSLKVVRSLDLPVREHALALVEMAWSRYYLKQYGKALGILKVVDSPFFESLRSPEVDLVRMNVGRDLCRYDFMKSTAAEFRERYAKTFKLIDSRQRFDGDQMLKQMALQGPVLQKSATLIHRYRTERRALAEEDIAISEGLREFLVKGISLRERMLDAEINRALPIEMERVANDLVVIRQQIASLESAALNKPTSTRAIDDSEFGQESISKSAFNRTYWPVGAELWWDELDKFEVWMQPHCPEGARNRTKSDE